MSRVVVKSNDENVVFTVNEVVKQALGEEVEEYRGKEELKGKLLILDGRDDRNRREQLRFLVDMREKGIRECTVWFMYGEVSSLTAQERSQERLDVSDLVDRYFRGRTDEFLLVKYVRDVFGVSG